MVVSHIRQRVKNGCQHIMACPLAKAWVVLVVVHFVIQIALQGITLRDNKQAKNITDLCISLSQVPAGLPLLEGNSLSMCNGIPGHNDASCILIASARGSPPPPSLSNMDSGAFAGFDLDDTRGITLSGSEHFITGRCAMSLQWLHDAFQDNAAEDIATICFQFWLLIVSLWAVLQDSIPHLAVCIASHLLDVGWAGFRIKSTVALRQDYYTFVVDGACGTKDLLGNWWDQRLAHAVPLFVTNVITLILLGALSLILFRQYASLTFSRVGVSPPVTRMYKIALSFSAFLQLAAFFSIMAAGMWIDRVSSSTITALADHIQAYQATFVVLAGIIAPWIISGWWAIFREIEWAFILFAILHVFILTLWPTMFASTIYRYVFGTWSFFACVSVTSYLFVVAAAAMAIICRLNFGRGLAHFLRVEADLSSSGFPGSFFTNDAPYARDGSPTSFDFVLLDVEKARKGSKLNEKEGPMHIQPYALESSDYSSHSLSFETRTDDYKTPVIATFPPPGTTSAATIRTSLNKGNVKIIPTVDIKPASRPASYLSCTDSDAKSATFARDKETAQIQPPPEAHLQAPYKETRSRKDTPSLMTQATGTSTTSYSHAVITFASKNPVVSAAPKTMLMNTMSSRYISSEGTVLPREDRLTTVSGTNASIKRASQDAPSRVNFPLQLDSHGRI